MAADSTAHCAAHLFRKCLGNCAQNRSHVVSSFPANAAHQKLRMSRFRMAQWPPGSCWASQSASSSETRSSDTADAACALSQSVAGVAPAHEES